MPDLSAKCLSAKFYRAGQRKLGIGQVPLIWVTLLAAFVTCISINHGEPPLLKELHAECTREGHYETSKCRYISHRDDDDGPTKGMEPSGTNFSFLIPMNECGTVYYEGAPSVKQQKRNDTRTTDKSNDNEVYIENTLLIQTDPTIQEATDLAKTLRCVWQKEIRQPLMAALPFGNIGKIIHRDAQRVKTITATRHTLQHDHQTNTSNKNVPILNLRFQKKGQVQSVPFNERRHNSRALELDDEFDTDPELDPVTTYFSNKSDLISPLALQRQQNYISSSATPVNTPPILKWTFLVVMRFMVLLQCFVI
ncbi:uncharacterized protein LOC110851463 isoform X2 [Folsomia candida]|uniref:uncharacterized protein LOC110851463 isoform X2 n=1 Tax=Folsomia candida TaxID=158441 RepID=UPI0016052934|nr:uncharacterized protein LOC110851463 isoform X2 [Folsomia candida]